MKTKRIDGKLIVTHVFSVGDRVFVYTDPMTEKHLEGRATVREVHSEVEHYYSVEFEDQPGEMFPRFIYPTPDQAVDAEILTGGLCDRDTG